MIQIEDKSAQPTGQPTSQPTSPSSEPTSGPSSQPTTQPSSGPSSVPSSSPSYTPTHRPSRKPTMEPQILGVPEHSAVQYGSVAGVLLFIIGSIVLYFRFKYKSSHSLVKNNDDGDIALMAREEGNKGADVMHDLLCSVYVCTRVHHLLETIIYFQILHSILFIRICYFKQIGMRRI